MQSEGQVVLESATVRSRADREISLKCVDVKGGQELTSSSLNSALKCCRISTIL